MEKLYTLKEAAEYLRVTVQTLYLWHDAGKLKFKRINGAPRIAESAILEIIKEEP